MRRLFAAAEEEHAIALKSAKQQAAEQEASDVQWEQLQASEGVSHISHCLLQTLTTMCCFNCSPLMFRQACGKGNQHRQVFL